MSEQNVWVPTTSTCPKCCKPNAVEYQVVESSCGDYEDEHYRCRECGHSWWIDGPDA